MNKIKTIDLYDVTDKIDVKNVSKQEFECLVSGYLKSVYDIIKSSESNIKLGGMMFITNKKEDKLRNIIKKI